MKRKYDKRDNKGRHIRPLFFKYIDDYKGYRDDYHIYEETDENEFNKCLVTKKYSAVRQLKDGTSKNLHIERGRMSYSMHKTSMDYLQKAIDSFSRVRLSKKECIPFSEVLVSADALPGYVKYPQVHRLLDIIKDSKQRIWETWNCRNDLSPSQKRKMSHEIKEELIEYVSSLSISEKSVRYILSLIDSEEYKGLSRFIFDVILDTSNEQFYKLLSLSKTPIPRLEECEDGDIDIMGFKYKMIQNA